MPCTMDATVREIVQLALRAQGVEDFCHLALDQVRHQVGFEGAIWFDLSPRRGAPPFARDIGAPQGVRRWYQHGVNAQEMQALHHEAIAQQGALLIDARFAQSIEGPTLWSEFFSPTGVRSMAGIFLGEGAWPSVIGLARDQPLRTTRAQARELERMRQLRAALMLGYGHCAASEASAQAQALCANLTSREREITELVACGLTNPEIGDMLHISPNTVRNMLARTFEKVGASTRAELAMLWTSGASS